MCVSLPVDLTAIIIARLIAAAQQKPNETAANVLLGTTLRFIDVLSHDGRIFKFGYPVSVSPVQWYRPLFHEIRSWLIIYKKQTY